MIVIKNIKNSLYAHINWSTKKIEYKSFPMLTDNNWEDISQMWNGNLEQTKEYVLSNIRNHPDYNDLKLIRIWFYEESQPIDWDKLISLIKQADVYLRINAPILAERIRNILTQLELRSIPKEQPIDLDDERLDKVLSDCGVKPGYLKEYRLLFKDVISRLSLSIPKEQSFMKNKDNTDSDYDQ